MIPAFSKRALSNVSLRYNSRCLVSFFDRSLPKKEYAKNEQRRILRNSISSTELRINNKINVAYRVGKIVRISHQKND